MTEPLSQATQQQLILFSASSQQAEDGASAHQLGDKGIRFHRGSSQEKEQDSLTALIAHRHALSPALCAAQICRITANNRPAAVSKPIPPLEESAPVEYFQPLGHRLSAIELSTRLEQISNASAQGLEILETGDSKDRYFLEPHH